MRSTNEALGWMNKSLRSLVLQQDGLNNSGRGWGVESVVEAVVEVGLGDLIKTTGTPAAASLIAA